MLSRIRYWLRAIVRGSALERDMREEMRLHLDRATDRLTARGLSPDEARLAARSTGGTGRRIVLQRRRTARHPRARAGTSNQSRRHVLPPEPNEHAERRRIVTERGAHRRSDRGGRADCRIGGDVDSGDRCRTCESGNNAAERVKRMATRPACRRGRTDRIDALPAQLCST